MTIFGDKKAVVADLLAKWRVAGGSLGWLRKSDPLLEKEKCNIILLFFDLLIQSLCMLTKVRFLFFIFYILIFHANCRKSPANVQRGAPLDYTPVPITTPVNTGLTVYVINNNQTSNPIKTFPVTNSSKNYVSVEILNVIPVEIYPYTNSTYSLPGNGQILVPSFGFGPPTGSLNITVNFAYLHPSLDNYAVSLPCYPAGDDNGKRWFLNSYGIYYLAPFPKRDINPDDTIMLKLSIQPAQAASAPDSIAVWNLATNNEWQKNGYAKRSGNFYLKRVTGVGFWNFAVEEDGVYVTLQLRTNAGIPVLNTRVILKDAIGEVADGRTDEEGNVLLFIPSHVNLTLDLINDHFFNWSGIGLSDQNLGSFTSATNKTFTLPGRVDLATINGKVFNCDGSPLKNGTAVLVNTYPQEAKDKYTFPIVDGVFKASSWINYSYDFGSIIIKDNSGKTLDTTVIVMGSPVNAVKPFNYDMNFYNCADAPELYCNYRIDSVSYNISSRVTDAGPVLTHAYNDPSNPDIITIGNNGQGVTFQGYFQHVMDNYFFSTDLPDLPTGLKVNGIDYAVDPSSVITLTRRDSYYGGFVEGWFSINYGGTHNIAGNFRIKRVPYK